MIPSSFKYFRPSSLGEAFSILSRYKESCKIIAGGQSLVPLMKLRLVSIQNIVDINKIHGLDHIKEEENYLSIGPLARHADFERSELIKKRYPIMHDASKVIGDPQVRNMGTLAGSIAHADPAGDWGSVMLALRAEVIASSEGGNRKISIDDFFLGPFTTALKSDEIITEVRVPRPREKTSGAYLKLERKAGDFAILGVAVQLSLDNDNKCVYAGIGLTNAGNTNVRAKKAEEYLIGREIDDKAVEEASKLAKDSTDPPSDVRASPEYRKAMVEVLTKRAIRKAMIRIGRGNDGRTS